MMRPALELTSVPRWAVTVTNPDADLSGRYWTVIAFGPGTADVVGRTVAPKFHFQRGTSLTFFGAPTPGRAGQGDLPGGRR